MKKHTLTLKSMDFNGSTRTAILQQSLGEITAFTIKGLKKNESITLSEPDLSLLDASCVVPFWAGAASDSQVSDFITYKLSVLENMFENPDQFPSFYRIMLLEFLLAQKRKNDALRLINKSYGVFSERSEIYNRSGVKARQTLFDLIPYKLILSLYGIEKWTPDEIILENDDALLPPITVQYGQTTIEFLQGKRKITHANGESTILDKPGKTRVLTA